MNLRDDPHRAFAVAALAGALILSACAATTDDSLLKSVPVGSGTSHLPVLAFVDCVKTHWTPKGGRLRQYSPDVEGQILAVHAAGSPDTVLVLAEPSANGTGYTIYGDTAAATGYVAATHACD
jgi:hypothetical protein